MNQHTNHKIINILSFPFLSVNPITIGFVYSPLPKVSPECFESINFPNDWDHRPVLIREACSNDEN